MVKKIDFDSTKIGGNSLNSDGKDQVDDLKWRPEDLALNPEMEEFANSELDFFIFFFVVDFSL
jgi:hypothetical protein